MSGWWFAEACAVFAVVMAALLAGWAMSDQKHPVVKPFPVSRDMFVEYLNHLSYLDIEKVEPVGTNQIRVTWKDYSTVPTIITVGE